MATIQTSAYLDQDHIQRIWFIRISNTTKTTERRLDGLDFFLAFHHLLAGGALLLTRVTRHFCYLLRIIEMLDRSGSPLLLLQDNADGDNRELCHWTSRPSTEGDKKNLHFDWWTEMNIVLSNPENQRVQEFPKFMY